MCLARAGTVYKSLLLFNSPLEQYFKSLRKAEGEVAGDRGSVASQWAQDNRKVVLSPFLPGVTSLPGGRSLAHLLPPVP